MDKLLMDNTLWSLDEGPQTFTPVRMNGWQLEVAQVRVEKLPETEWPGNPGDPFYGILGTTRDVIVGWEPLDWSGVLRTCAGHEWIVARGQAAWERAS